VFVRVLSLAALAWLVVGVPVFTGSCGWIGLAFSISWLLFFSAILAACTALSLRRCGMPRRAALLASLGLLNPFSSHRAAELVQLQVVAGVPRLAVAYVLLGEERFVRELRTLVFDAFHSTGSSNDRDVLLCLIDAERIEALLQTSIVCDEGENFCPRCGTRFNASVSQCSDCEVPLSVCASLPAFGAVTAS